VSGWTNEPAHAIAAAIKAGAVTAEAVTTEHLSRIASDNDGLAAFTDVTADRALAEARAIDRQRAAGETLPALAGVPYAVKNLFDIAGLPTRAGSRINRDRPASTRDATAVERMAAAGAVLLGGLNMGEYAYDFTGINPHDGPSRNPHDRSRMTGGSSGGSAAAVAAGLAPIALGSDTNGSIRVPASLAGLFGLKPTYGALSRGGTFPFVASLDHVGPLARSVMDLALTHDAMAGLDPRDVACVRPAGAPLAGQVDAGIAGLRIARAGDYFARAGTAEAFAAVGTVASALGVTETVIVPEAHRARAAAYVITMIEGAALHLDRLRERHADYDPDVRDRLIAGAMLPGTWYAKAQKFRRWFRDEVVALFGSVDAILAPATPVVAPRISEKTFVLDGVELPVRPNMGIYTQPISFIGLPVVAVPTWTASGLPIGVQIITAPGREDIALRIARQLEKDGVCVSRVAG
jgi:aspartyl-tRNA(Asn)/glutamyl-tRNA(Gln) amidotransferase subunit A